MLALLNRYLKFGLLFGQLVVSFLSSGEQLAGSREQALDYHRRQEQAIWKCNRETDFICELPGYYDVCVRWENRNAQQLRQRPNHCQRRERISKLRIQSERPAEPAYKMAAGGFQKQYFQAFPHYFPMPVQDPERPRSSDDAASRIETSLRTHAPSPLSYQEEDALPVSNPNRNIYLRMFQCNSPRNLVLLLRRESLRFQVNTLLARDKSEMEDRLRSLSAGAAVHASNLQFVSSTVLGTLDGPLMRELNRQISDYSDQWDNPQVTLPPVVYRPNSDAPAFVETFPQEGLYGWGIFGGRPRNWDFETSGLLMNLRSLKSELEDNRYTITDPVISVLARRSYNPTAAETAELQTRYAAINDRYGLNDLGARNGLNRAFSHMLLQSIRSFKTSDQVHSAREGRTPSESDLLSGLRAIKAYLTAQANESNRVDYLNVQTRPESRSRVGISLTTDHVARAGRILSLVDELISQKKTIYQGKHSFEQQYPNPFDRPESIRTRLSHFDQLIDASRQVENYFMLESSTFSGGAIETIRIAKWMYERVNSIQGQRDLITNMINDGRFTAAEADCGSRVVADKPLPIGAIFGALRKQFTSAQTFEPDLVVTTPRGETLRLIEVELVHLPRWSAPFAFRAFEDTGPSSRRSKAIIDGLERDNFDLYRASLLGQEMNTFMALLFGGSSGSTGESASPIGETQRRYFLSIEDLQSLRETALDQTESRRPLTQKIFRIQNFWDFLRGTGGSGVLITPSFYSALPGSQVTGHVRNLDANMTRNLVRYGTSSPGNTAVDVSFLPEGIRQLPRTNSIVELLRQMEQAQPSHFGPRTHGRAILEKFMQHSFFIPVDLMVKAAQVRKQVRPTEMCLQYVKDATLLGRVVELRNTSGHAINSTSGFVGAERIPIESTYASISAFTDEGSEANENTGATAVGGQFTGDLRSDLNVDSAMEDVYQPSQAGGMGSLEFLCRSILATISFSDVADPQGLVDRVCTGSAFGGAYSRNRAQQARDREVLARYATATPITVPGIRHWLANNPFVECLGPYAAINVYRGGCCGHIEIKTEEMGYCGFVSDYYDSLPISQSSYATGNQTNLRGARFLQNTLIVKTPQ